MVEEKRILFPHQLTQKLERLVILCLVRVEIHQKEKRSAVASVGCEDYLASLSQVVVELKQQQYG
jgi:hypothetical protein